VLYAPLASDRSLRGLLAASVLPSRDEATMKALARVRLSNSSKLRLVSAETGAVSAAQVPVNAAQNRIDASDPD
jgi:hypothetical protein